MVSVAQQASQPASQLSHPFASLPTYPPGSYTTSVVIERIIFLGLTPTSEVTVVSSMKRNGNNESGSDNESGHDNDSLRPEKGPMWQEPGLPPVAYVIHRANLPIAEDWQLTIKVA